MKPEMWENPVGGHCKRRTRTYSLLLLFVILFYSTFLNGMKLANLDVRDIYILCNLLFNAKQKIL